VGDELVGDQLDFELLVAGHRERHDGGGGDGLVAGRSVAARLVVRAGDGDEGGERGDDRERAASR
jgi:hypothetical protein